MTVDQNKDVKTYNFITKYLVLLALPMLLAVGCLYAFSLLIHRVSMEQKVSALNHTLTVAEQGIIEQVEQLLAVEVAIYKPDPTHSSEARQALAREVWAEKVRLAGMLDLIFMSDAQGVVFTSDAKWDAKQAERNAKNPGRTATESTLYRQALASLSPFFWAPPYRDSITGRQTITLFHRLDLPGNEGLMLGVDVNLSSWSEKLGNMLFGNNAIRHMLINRANGQVLVHTDASRIGEHVKGSWQTQLIAQSGSFYSADDDEFVSYEAMPKRPEWLAITVQSKRDTISQQILIVTLLLLVLSSSLFVVSAIFFRTRLEGVINTLTHVVRLLRLSPEKDMTQLVLPNLPEMVELQKELNLVSDRMLQSYTRSRQDSLTTLYNRRYLDEAQARLQAQGVSYVFALIDLDRFKSINDTHGHAIGDKVLRRVSALGLELLGDSATLCRYGGEELAVIFEQVTLEDAEWQVERWRLGVSELEWRESNLTVTFSAGIGASKERTVEDLLKAVDEALYRAKEDGRNRLCRALSTLA